MISPGAVFHFSRILLFWVVTGVKEQKMAQNEKKYCLSRSISQKPYIIWFSFMVHICKMIVSTSIFCFIFSKFWFSALSGGKRAKIIPKWQKILFVLPHISGAKHRLIFIYGTRLSSDNMSRCFFPSFKTLILWVVSGEKGQKMAQNVKKIISVTLHMSGTIHHVIAIYGTLV